jgi:putative PIN family toxin of toxin-antitoxin system
VRVFLDTNVVVSAVATRGLCADLFRVVVAEHELVVGEVVLEELRRVLRANFRVPAERVTELEELLRGYETVDRPAQPEPVGVRDSADAWNLASARAAAVDVLITGDDDLLTLAERLPFRVLSPRAFWNELRAGPR